MLPNRGARVASLSQAEIEEMIEVIAGLEATAADLACRTIGDDEIAAIEQDHHDMVRAWKDGEEATYFRLNRAIHEAIMAASRNSVLGTIYASLSAAFSDRATLSTKPPSNGAGPSPSMSG